MVKKKYNIFNYFDLIDDIKKCQKLYINKNGSNNSNNTLKSELKSLNKFYYINNMCESIHSKLSKIMPNGAVTKESFRNAIKYIIKV